MRRIRRPGHATVVAYVALFVALGGSSYAALKVGSKQIVNNSVRSGDIRNNTVASKDVKNRSLLARDFKAGQLPAGGPGPQGPAGAKGSPAGSVVQGSTGEELITTGGSVETFPPSGYSPEEPGFGNGDYQVSPNATIVVRDLVGRLETAPGTAAGRTFEVYDQDRDQAVLSCSVVATQTSCNSGNATGILPPRTVYSLRINANAGTPTSSSAASWAFRALTP